MGTEDLSQKSDERLAELYREGSSEAFTELFSRYEKKLVGFLYNRIAWEGKATIDDLFQVVWLKVHDARFRFDSSQKFSTWFYTIALNTIRDHMGSARKKWEESTEDVALEQMPDTEDAERRVIATIEVKKLRLVLGHLNEVQKECLLLSDLEGLSGKEIAEVLSISEAAVRQNVSRARKQVKERFEGTEE